MALSPAPSRSPAGGQISAVLNPETPTARLPPVTLLNNRGLSNRAAKMSDRLFFEQSAKSLPNVQRTKSLGIGRMKPRSTIHPHRKIIEKEGLKHPLNTVPTPVSRKDTSVRYECNLDKTKANGDAISSSVCPLVPVIVSTVSTLYKLERQAALRQLRVSAARQDNPSTAKDRFLPDEQLPSLSCKKKLFEKDSSTVNQTADADPAAFDIKESTNELKTIRRIQNGTSNSKKSQKAWRIIRAINNPESMSRSKKLLRRIGDLSPALPTRKVISSRELLLKKWREQNMMYRINPRGTNGQTELSNDLSNESPTAVVVELNNNNFLTSCNSRATKSPDMSHITTDPPPSSPKSSHSSRSGSPEDEASIEILDILEVPVNTYSLHDSTAAEKSTSLSSSINCPELCSFPSDGSSSITHRAHNHWNWCSLQNNLHDLGFDLVRRISDQGFLAAAVYCGMTYAPSTKYMSGSSMAAAATSASDLQEVPARRSLEGKVVEDVTENDDVEKMAYIAKNIDPSYVQCIKDNKGSDTNCSANVVSEVESGAEPVTHDYNCAEFRSRLTDVLFSPEPEPQYCSKRIETSFSKPENTLFIWDWDDTLLPTYYLAIQLGLGLEALRPFPQDARFKMALLQTMAISSLETCMPNGSVVIITNASYRWVADSGALYMPDLWNFICHHKIRVLSARDICQQLGLRQPDWKKFLIRNHIEQFFGHLDSPLTRYAMELDKLRQLNFRVDILSMFGINSRESSSSSVLPSDITSDEQKHKQIKEFNVPFELTEFLDKRVPKAVRADAFCRVVAAKAGLNLQTISMTGLLLDVKPGDKVGDKKQENHPSDPDRPDLANRSSEDSLKNCLKLNCMTSSSQRVPPQVVPAVGNAVLPCFSIDRAVPRYCMSLEPIPGIFPKPPEEFKLKEITCSVISIGDGENERDAILSVMSYWDSNHRTLVGHLTKIRCLLNSHFTSFLYFLEKAFFDNIACCRVLTSNVKESHPLQAHVIAWTFKTIKLAQHPSLMDLIGGHGIIHSNISRILEASYSVDHIVENRGFDSYERMSIALNSSHANLPQSKLLHCGGDIGCQVTQKVAMAVNDGGMQITPQKTTQTAPVASAYLQIIRSFWEEKTHPIRCSY